MEVFTMLRTRGRLPQVRRRPLPVLVVDDDRAARQSMKWLLEGDGYRVVTAASGARALERLRKGLAPCAILLDLRMPDMDGLAFRKAQTGDPELAAIPVVVFSGGSAAGDDAAWRGVAHLQKPFDAQAVLKLIGRYCRPAD
jgi:CheY-like chemotaxis protein